MTESRKLQTGLKNGRRKGEGGLPAVVKYLSRSAVPNTAALYFLHLP